MVPLRLIRRAAVATGALLVATSPALAHTPNERLGDFWGGFVHPLTTIEHLPAILALGILTGQQGKALARRALLVLPGSFALGSVLAALGPVPEAVAIVNRLSFVVLGGLAAAAWRLPPALALGLVAAAGLGHGWENAGAVPEGRRLPFAAGSTAAAAFLFTLVSAGVATRPVGWTRIVPRILGSWIAAIGLLILALPS